MVIMVENECTAVEHERMQEGRDGIMGKRDGQRIVR